jgi:hypothetical protein
MPAAKSDNWTSLKKQLQQMEKKDLIAIIHDLHKLSEQNRRFLKARLAPDAANNQALLKEYKRLITEKIFGKRSIEEGLQMAQARQLISEYQKATNDPLGTLDLMLHFVETGTEFTNDYGDIDEPFYNSLEAMLDKFCEGIFNLSGETDVKSLFAKRIEALIQASSGTGWGYGDYLRFNMMTKCYSRKAFCEFPYALAVAL